MNPVQDTPKPILRRWFWRRWFWLAGGLLVLLCLLGAGLWRWLTPTEDPSARATLDRLLSTGREQPLPETRQEDPPLPEGEDLAQALGSNLEKALTEPATGPQLKETPNNYQLTVPLDTPEDANGVQVQVLPHQIRYSQQVRRQGQGPFGLQTQFSSTVLRTFQTEAALSPQGLRREVKGQQLIITVPKQQPGTAPPPGVAPQKTTPPAVTAPDGFI